MQSHRNFYKEWENQQYDDEFYDRSKSNRFNRNKSKSTVTRADIKEGDTFESVKARLNSKMKERDALMQKLIEINHIQNQKKSKNDFDELDDFMEQNEKQIKKDEKEYVANRLTEVNVEIGKHNSMLSLLMPSSFSTAKKAEPKKMAQPLKVTEKPHQKQSKKPKLEKNTGLSSVFQRLSAMADKKEKELKLTQKQPEESEQSEEVQETPRFYQSESGTELMSVTDIEASKCPLSSCNKLSIDSIQDEKMEEGAPKTFFSDIVNNIKPVGEDDSIDTSKYSSFLQEYNDFHRNKAYSKESTKRQKVTEDTETTTFRLGGESDQQS